MNENLTTALETARKNFLTAYENFRANATQAAYDTYKEAEAVYDEVFFLVNPWETSSDAWTF